MDHALEPPLDVGRALGLLTAGVDTAVHPGGFDTAFAEAVVTGAGAAALSLAVSVVVHKRAPREAPERVDG